MKNYNFVKKAITSGLLSFPITDFDSQGNLNIASYADRIRWFLSYEISAVFVAGGTGEFFSLSLDEYNRITNIAVEQTKAKVPVIAGVGKSIKEAVLQARMAQDNGVNGLLLMPPYLTGCPQNGLMSYAEAILNQTDLPVIYYNRANGILDVNHIEELAKRCKNLVGVKDGTGNLDQLNAITTTLGDRLGYVGGVPTAEILAQAYFAVGVTTYSSAVFNFVPDLAVFFYNAVQKGDNATVTTLIKEFFIPLRNQKTGYGVSLIKSGAKLINRNGGDVRFPLEMPSEKEENQLNQLINHAYSTLQNLK